MDREVIRAAISGKSEDIYIFDHLWLLDPAWERTKGTEHAETLVSKFLEKNSNDLKGAEKKSRIDIGYRTTSGKHVIIELKRASVAVPLDTLTGQIRKYRDGAKPMEIPIGLATSRERALS